MGFLHITEMWTKHTHVHMCTHKHMHVCTRVLMYIYAYVYVYVCAHIHMHAHTCHSDLGQPAAERLVSHHVPLWPPQPRLCHLYHWSLSLHAQPLLTHPESQKNLSEIKICTPLTQKYNWKCAIDLDMKLWNFQKKTQEKILVTKDEFLNMTPRAWATGEKLD